jgi:hypothetical protein
MQHSVYFWEVTRDDVVRLDRVTEGSRFVDRTLKEWLGGLDKDRREQFIGALYAILGATEAKSFPELTEGWFKNASLMIQSLTSVDEETRDMIFSTLAALFKAARNNIDVLLPKTAAKKIPPKSPKPAFND